MTGKNFAKQTTTIGRGKKESSPIYTRGGQVRYFGVPVNQNGSSALVGYEFSLRGSFDGSGWFSLCDFEGKPVRITLRANQKVLPQNGQAVHPAILPIQAAVFTEGIQFIQLVGNAPEVEDQQIDVYFE